MRIQRKNAEEFVLEKFSGKNKNSKQWLETFERECKRFNVEDDTQKIEIFRLFLEKSALDWYGSMLMKLTLE